MEQKGQNGGARPGAGRKPKADEIALIEKLSPMNADAFKALHRGIKEGSFPFIKLYMEYVYGKPRETKDIDITTNGESFSLTDLIKFK